MWIGPKGKNRDKNLEVKSGVIWGMLYEELEHGVLLKNWHIKVTWKATRKHHIEKK